MGSMPVQKAARASAHQGGCHQGGSDKKGQEGGVAAAGGAARETQPMLKNKS